MRNPYTAREQDSKIEQTCACGQFTAESHAEGFNVVDPFDASYE